MSIFSAQKLTFFSLTDDPETTYLMPVVRIPRVRLAPRSQQLGADKLDGLASGAARN